MLASTKLDGLANVCWLASSQAAISINEKSSRICP
uniref:Uncharacterized protein n=1 Tax=Anguilla anguilla TaxID=7936 RepID=A0A0E9V8Q3_ANGAN